MSADEDVPFTGEYLDFAELSREELQSKLLELLTLVETSRELLRANDAEDMARRVLLSAIGVLGASSACILRVGQPRHDRLELLQQFGLDTDAGVSFEFEPAHAAAFVEAADARPFRVDSDLTRGAAQTFLREQAALLRQLEAAVVCPLLGRAGLFGFFVLGQRLLAEGYSARDLDLFFSLSELYSLALERAATRAPRPRLSHPQESESVGADQLAVREELARLRERHPPLRDIQGESESILALFRDLIAFADSRATILILGESGTGKELVAKAIHGLSRRRNKPLEIVDCSSIPKELIESELFGHVRGAFTGAVRDRRGAFELAHTGTLFLDEIGEMTLASQTRLLRVLQEGKFRPVGSERTLSVDVRFLAATNIDLREAAQRGEFRKDLFYRIQVFPLRLPPLRDRHGDIEVLTRAFLKRYCADDGRPEPQVESEVFERLRTHSFPGNVRELQNMMEALAIRSRGEGVVRIKHLEEVWRSQRIGRGPAQAPVRAAGVVSAAPAIAGTGRMVRDAWRACGFNLLEASRELRARRTDGRRVSVVDRAQLSHYLDGEILRAFREAGDLDRCVESLASGQRHAHRARKRIERVLGELLRQWSEDPTNDPFPRLPEEYRDDVESLRRHGVEWLIERLTVR